MTTHTRPRRRRRTNSLPLTIQALAFLVAAFLIPAVGLAIGTVGEEIGDRLAGESIAAQYPAGDPTRCHRDALAAATADLPGLGIDWRWADLSSRHAVGTALLQARIGILHAGMDCTEVPGTAWHEWAHFAQADYYGDATTTLRGRVTSDLVDATTKRPFTVAVHEVVADCAAMLLADQYGDRPDRGPYLRMLGGCPPDMLAMAREIVTHAGVTLTAGTSSALGSVGAGVA